MILMGNVPQASSSIEDVTDESAEESHIIKAPKEGNVMRLRVHSQNGILKRHIRRLEQGV